ncbi:E3 ubiquitin-protein ligase CCNB1IP1 [Spea bombifrons]|uniref:E3 ubiquitin-protein ligase CCNB1IP1 n=1 Tax=Spea bombifrons TaxID=233779 RepID=UPI00234AB5FF|nr:E3 ubiquitin-protein ligase CCNB1IP1 [Spea bombifrons]
MSVCEDLLLCNYRKCRVKLSGYAWVTACSHIFCDQHGSGEFSRSPAVCPACNSTLSGKLDIVRTELSPSEEYKAMMMAGLRPELVLDICSRALTFWTYQVYQERLYQEYTYSKAEGHLKQMEKLYAHQMQSKDSELTAMKGEMNSLKKMLEEYKRKYSELSEKLMDRNRQYQKLQGMYDALRLRNIAVANRESSASGDRIQHDPISGFGFPFGHSTKFPAARTPPARSGDGDLHSKTFFCISPSEETGHTIFCSPRNETGQEGSRAFKISRM